jgi:hypothetical protein
MAGVIMWTHSFSRTDENTGKFQPTKPVALWADSALAEVKAILK